MSTTTSGGYDADAARATALDALRAWASTREHLPEQRATLLAMAWHTGTRNIRELARLAGITRDAVYADLKARDIDVRDREAVTVPPQARPLTSADVRPVVNLASAQFLPAMLGEKPDPLGSAAWTVMLALSRIADLADGLADPANDEDRTDRLDRIDDLVGRGRGLIADAHRLMAGEYTSAELVQHTENTTLVSPDVNEPVISSATVTVELPIGQSITIDVVPKTPPHPVNLTSTSEHLAGRPGAETHLAITEALAALADALAQCLTDDAFIID